MKMNRIENKKIKYIILIVEILLLFVLYYAIEFSEDKINITRSFLKISFNFPLLATNGSLNISLSILGYFVSLLYNISVSNKNKINHISMSLSILFILAFIFNIASYIYDLNININTDLPIIILILDCINIIFFNNKLVFKKTLTIIFSIIFIFYLAFIINKISTIQKIKNYNKVEYSIIEPIINGIFREWDYETFFTYSSNVLITDSNKEVIKDLFSNFKTEVGEISNYQITSFKYITESQDKIQYSIKLISNNMISVEILINLENKDNDWLLYYIKFI